MKPAIPNHHVMVNAAFTYTLKYPIPGGDGTLITELVVRRGTRGDFKKADRYSQNQFDQETFLYAQLTGLTIEDIEALDMEDNLELASRFQEALGRRSQ